MRTSKDYLTLTKTRELATITCTRQRLKGRQESGKVEKRAGFRYALAGGHWHGEAVVEWGTLCDD